MLHTLSQPECFIDLTNLIALVTQNDAVLLWQDGVNLGINNSTLLKQLSLQKIPVFALIDDIRARGLKPIYDPYVQVITIADCITLTEKYYPQLAW